MLNVSSVHYLSMQGLALALGLTLAQLRDSHCTGCLDYHNPFDMQEYDSEYSRTSYIQRRVKNQPQPQIQTQIV